MVWPVDFDASQSAPSSQKFVADYTAEYNEPPLNYAAEGYDAAWFLARSIKDSGDASRTGIKSGMATEAGKTADGALGADLTWKDGTIQVPGVVVQWDGTAAKLLYAADS
jgi:branched-chain amino acid transport system substrate-binding protein